MSHEFDERIDIHYASQKKRIDEEINNAWLYHDYGLTEEEINAIDQLNKNYLHTEDLQIEQVIEAIEKFLGIDKK